MNSQAFWQQFEVYLRWSFEALIAPTPLLGFFFALSLSLAISTFRQKPWRKRVWHWSYWFALSQLFFPATIAVGVLFPAISSWPSPQANATGERWLNFTFYGSLATGVYWIYSMKGLRWFAASLIGLQQLVLACAGFIAGMSVTGQWL